MLHRHAGKAEHQGVKCQDMGGGGTGSCHAWKTQEGLGGTLPPGMLQPLEVVDAFWGSAAWCCHQHPVLLGCTPAPSEGHIQPEGPIQPWQDPPLHLNPSPQP